MALFYVYYFMYTPPKSNQNPTPEPEEKAIYAVSEKQARRKFLKYFDQEAKELLRRTRW